MHRTIITKCAPIILAEAIGAHEDQPSVPWWTLIMDIGDGTEAQADFCLN